MNASSDLAISLMSYPTKAASCSLVKSVRGCLCKNTSKSRSQALRTTGVRARRCATSVAPALDGFEVEIEPPPDGIRGRQSPLIPQLPLEKLSCTRRFAQLPHGKAIRVPRSSGRKPRPSVQARGPLDWFAMFPELSGPNIASISLIRSCVLVFGSVARIPASRAVSASWWVR